MALSRDDLALLLESFEESEWTEVVLSVDGIRVELTKPGAEPPAPEPAQAVAHQVPSPSIGVFHPNASPGDTVEPDDPVATLQVLKVTLDVKAGTSGVVRAVHAADGDIVEYGQPLFTIED